MRGKYFHSKKNVHELLRGLQNRMVKQNSVCGTENYSPNVFPYQIRPQEILPI